MAYKIMINGDVIIYNMPEIRTIYPASRSYKYVPLPRTTSATHCFNSDFPEADMRHGLICKPLMKKKHWETNKGRHGTQDVEWEQVKRADFHKEQLYGKPAAGPWGYLSWSKKRELKLNTIPHVALSEELFQEEFKFPGTSGSCEVLQDKLNHP